MPYSTIETRNAYRRYRFIKVLKNFVIFSIIMMFVVIALLNGGYIGIKVAAISIAVALAVFFGLKLYIVFDRTWDGEVVAKNKTYTYAKSLKMMLNQADKGPRDKQGGSMPYVRSELKVRRNDDGKIFKHVYVEHDESDLVCYYRTGDRVRHYAGLKLYEKENKSKDRRVMCLRCMLLEPKENIKCKKCGFILPV